MLCLYPDIDVYICMPMKTNLVTYHICLFVSSCDLYQLFASSELTVNLHYKNKLAYFGSITTWVKVELPKAPLSIFYIDLFVKLVTKECERI